MKTYIYLIFVVLVTSCNNMNNKSSFKQRQKEKQEKAIKQDISFSIDSFYVENEKDSLRYRTIDLKQFQTYQTFDEFSMKPIGEQKRKPFITRESKTLYSLLHPTTIIEFLFIQNTAINGITIDTSTFGELTIPFANAEISNLPIHILESVGMIALSNVKAVILILLTHIIRSTLKHEQNVILSILLQNSKTHTLYIKI